MGLNILTLRASKKYTDKTIIGEGTSQGKDGADGKSAYEIAKDNGFEGTEQEWLESLKGKNGQDAEVIPIDTEMSDTSENAVQNKTVKAYVDGKTNFKLIKTISANTTSLTESFDDLFNNKGYSEVILVDYTPYGIMKRYTFDGYSATSGNIELRFTTSGAIITSVAAINSITLKANNKNSAISVYEVNYAFLEDGTPNIKKTDGVSRDIYIYAR